MRTSTIILDFIQSVAIFVVALALYSHVKRGNK
jgi:hypothetical protein